MISAVISNSTWQFGVSIWQRLLNPLAALLVRTLFCPTTLVPSAWIHSFLSVIVCRRRVDCGNNQGFQNFIMKFKKKSLAKPGAQPGQHAEREHLGQHPPERQEPPLEEQEEAELDHVPPAAAHAVRAHLHGVQRPRHVGVAVVAEEVVPSRAVLGVRVRDGGVPLLRPACVGMTQEFVRGCWLWHVSRNTNEQTRSACDLPGREPTSNVRALVGRPNA